MAPNKPLWQRLLHPQNRLLILIGIFTAIIILSFTFKGKEIFGKALISSWGPPVKTEIILQRAVKTAIRILLWSQSNGEYDGNTRNEERPHEKIWTSSVFKCSSPCKFTRDKSHLNTSDVVVFTEDNLESLQISDFAATRRAEQIFIFFAEESPNCHMSNRSWGIYQGFFNVTVKYRQKFPGIFPGFAVENVTAGEIEMENVFVDAFKKKNKTVAYLLDQPASQAELDLIKTLSQYVHLEDVGNVSPRISLCDQIYRPPSFFQKLGQSFKFFLLLQNPCESPPSEFYGALSFNLIPVVAFQHQNDVLQAPSHSYVDLQDFSSPTELGKYLDGLERNEGELRAFFQWKTTQRVKSFRERPWCSLCHRLVEEVASSRGQSRSSGVTPDNIITVWEESNVRDECF